MPSNLKGEQLPITSYFLDSGRKNKEPAKENTSTATKKRKRRNSDEVGTSSKEVNNPGATSDKSSKGRPVRQGTAVLLNTANPAPLRPKHSRVSLTSIKDSVATHESGSSNTGFIHGMRTPVSISNSVPSNPVDRISFRDVLPRQLRTPPSTIASKRTAPLKIYKSAKNSNACGSSSHTPAADADQDDSIIRYNAQKITPKLAQTVGFGPPTPVTSAPRVERARLEDIPPRTVELVTESPMGPTHRSSPTSSSPIRVSDKPIIVDDVFASSKPSHAVPSAINGNKGSSPIPVTIDDIPFKALAMPDRCHVEKHSCELDHCSGSETCPVVSIGTSQSQDLRSYFPSPHKPRVNSSFTFNTTPKSFRFSQIGSKRPSYSDDSQLVGTSQSQEVGMHLPDNYSPSRQKLSGDDDRFILGKTHLPQTPTKPQYSSQPGYSEWFKTPTRTSFPSRDSVSPSKATFDNGIFPPSSSKSQTPLENVPVSSGIQLIDSLPLLSPSQCKLPSVNEEICPSFAPHENYSHTPNKQSLKLFETQTFSPNVARSFEAWRDMPRSYSISDSIQESFSEDISGCSVKTKKRLQVSRAEDDAQKITSNPTPASSQTEYSDIDDMNISPRMRTCGLEDKQLNAADPFPSSQTEYSKIAGTYVLEDKSNAPQMVSTHSDSMTQYSEADFPEQTPRPLREFLDMFDGDRSYADSYSVQIPIDTRSRYL